MPMASSAGISLMLTALPIITAGSSWAGNVRGCLSLQEPKHKKRNRKGLDSTFISWNVPDMDDIVMPCLTLWAGLNIGNFP